MVSQAPAEPRVLILRAIDAAAADRHARLGHAGDWRAAGGCDCLVKVQPIVSAAGATFYAGIPALAPGRPRQW